jgi:hypothetical protein
MMEWKLETLLDLVPRESDREELRGLGRRHNEAIRARAPAAEREAIVDEAMARVQDHFRAIRHPLPSRADVEQMLSEAGS